MPKIKTKLLYGATRKNNVISSNLKTKMSDFGIGGIWGVAGENGRQNGGII